VCQGTTAVVAAILVLKHDCKLSQQIDTTSYLFICARIHIVMLFCSSKVIYSSVIGYHFVSLTATPAVAPVDNSSLGTA
jgi:uncharacterized MAPEG superfamily protein